MKISMTGTIRAIVLFIVFFITTITTATRTARADAFADIAMNPAFLRDFHLVGIGANSVTRANTSDGQNIGYTSSGVGVAADIWNNEHNQVIVGVQYGQRDFDKKVALPDGFTLPQHLVNTSVGLSCKHITSADWSFSQSVRYNRIGTDSTTISGRDSIDLVGLAAISRKPGIAWVFGYIYDQTDYPKKPVLVPIAEYINNAHEQWAFTIGYPVLALGYFPHPDWAPGTTLGAAASISYKATQLNIVRLSIRNDSWAYRLSGPDIKGVAYTGSLAGFDWTYLYAIDHHTMIVLNASLGWEFNRKLGLDNKLSVTDAAVMGLNASLSF